jgi:hypothetical protein
MEQQRPRWRFRISALMLLVVIFGLSIALVTEQRRRQVAEELARAREAEARAVADLALARAQQARAAAEAAVPKAEKAKAPPGESPGAPTAENSR